MNPCEQMVKAMCELGGANAPVSYRFMAMFGKEFELKRVASITGKGLKQQCYRNSENVCTFQDSVADLYSYAEGYALKPGLIPLAHAWVVDKTDGKAIDPTWPEEGCSYFGVRFDPEWVNELTIKNGCYGVFESLHIVGRRLNIRNSDAMIAFLSKGLLK